MLSPIVFIGISGSGISLFLGLLIEISALAENNGFQANPSLASDIMFHPDLMVFGVIGWLLITERLELMEKFLVTGKIGISRMVVALLFSGVFSASLGILLGNEAIRFVGLSLLIAAFLYNLKRIMSSEGVKTAHDSNREVTGHRRRMSRIQGPHAISMSGMSCTSVYNDLPLKM